METNAMNTTTANPSSTAPSNFKTRQLGLLWIFVLLAGVGNIAGNILGKQYGNIVGGIIYILWALAMIYVDVEHKGDYLLVTYEPLRWALCGVGKEKIFYKNIKYFQKSRVPAYGWGLNIGLRLFSTCNLCCLCKPQGLVTLTIKERFQCENADDPDDCCLESCCLSNCCGSQNCEFCGSGCIFKYCFNPCNCNCCIMNKIYISTNSEQEADQLIEFLKGQCTDVKYADI